MKNNFNSNTLSSEKRVIQSIGSEVDKKKLENFFLKNLSIFEEILKKYPDQYGSEFLNYLKDNKEFNFPINKHVELYINKHLNDLEKIFKYAVFRYKFHKCGKEKINLGYPPYLLVEPVSTCNLRCPFCFQSDKSFTKKPYMGVMDFELYKKIIDEADELGVGAVTIASRGEPTLHKKLDKMIEYVANKKNIFEFKLNSNATFLSEKICHAIFKNNVNQVVISGDHYVKEHYERLRLNSNFEDVVKRVDMLFNIRKEFYPDSTTEIRISGIDNERTLDREKFRDFWIKRSDHVTASYPLERWNTYENKEDPKINDPCEFLWDRMYIWFDGKVNPCDADYKSYLSYGNFKEKTIKEIWNGEIIKKLREEHFENKRNKVNPCNKCGVTFC